MKINKVSRVKKKLKNKKVNRYLRKILPVVLMLRNFKEYSPEEVLEIISFITYPDNKHMLDEEEKKELSDYLNYWGYNGEWVYK